MKHPSIGAVAMLAACLAAPSVATARTDTPAALRTTCIGRSADLLNALQQGRFADATAHFDEPMAAALDAQKLGQVWQQMLPSQAGDFQSANPASARMQDNRAVVETPLTFSRAELTLRVSCNSDGTVGGLFFAPKPPASGIDPPVTHADGVHEQPMAVTTPLGPLPGTLALPAGKAPFPAVVLVAGSGPQDRDETIGPNKPLRDIALGLAQAGIASLRYDKRTRIYASAMAGKPITVDDEVTDDAEAAVAALRGAPRIDASRLFVAGHSLGALMAPRIAARSGPLAGVILLAAPTRLDLDVVVDQIHYLQSLHNPANADMLGKELASAEQARDALADADAAHPPQGDFFHAPASFWLSLRGYDPVETARTLSAPLLILQGMDDFQVPPASDFARWKKAFGDSPRATFHAYPRLSHLFMPAGKPPSPADYETASHVDPAVLHDMAAWILARQPVPR